MKFIPILFSTPMVQAILDGRKTQTRRIIHKNHQTIEEVTQVPRVMGMEDNWGDYRIVWESGDDAIVKPKYKVGDILWVRESFISGYECDEGSFNTDEDGEYIPVLKYKADRESFDWYDGNSDFPCEKIPWKPSIHMPKSACRIFLKITDVRVERLQDISEDDAVKEGIEPTGNMSMFNKFYKNYLPIGYTDLKPIPSFQSLWQSINREQSWNDNPFVWCIEFERIEKPENFK